jgi:hypothetical protein
MPTEHVATHDRRTDVHRGFLDNAIARVHLAAGLSVHLAPVLERKDPIVKPHPADAEGVIEALVWTGGKAVE